MKSTSIVSRSERALQLVLRMMIFAYLGVFLSYFYMYFWGNSSPFTDPLFTFNSSLKALFFVGITFIVSADIRRFQHLLKMLIWIIVICLIPGLIIYFMMDSNESVTLFGTEMGTRALLLITLIFEFVVAIIMYVLFKRYQRENDAHMYFSAAQFRSLVSLAEVVIEGDQELLTAEEIAGNVDRYFNGFRARQKWISKLVLLGLEYYPILALRAPLSYMNPESRKAFLIKRFQEKSFTRPLHRLFMQLISGGIRLANQLCFIGYYNDPRTFGSVGYVPFSDREDTPSRMEQFPPKPVIDHKLKVTSGTDVTTAYMEADVLIIGSGAGGSILAEGMLAKGRKVLMIDKGLYVKPEEMTEDEIDMTSKLYADGALQLARDFKFQVIQGSAIGGSTVVNNAVCFDTPTPILAKWNESTGLNAGLDISEYLKAQKAVNALIENKQGSAMSLEEHLNPSGKYFLQGCEKLGLDKAPNVLQSVSANIKDCLGCGYCNMGCKFGKKMSMLDTVLPMSQKKYSEDNFKIISECEAGQFKMKGSAIEEIECKLPNDRMLRIKAKTYIIAAGAVSSSLLLLKSKIARRKAGKNVGFNIGSPLNARFPFPINAYQGLQISHYLQIDPDPGYIFETWYNPPMFQSTTMPGWWDTHFNNMKKYDHFAAVGVLVGSESNGEVSPTGLFGRDINYSPTKKNFTTLKKALLQVGDIMLAGGSEAVILNTLFSYNEHTTKASLAEELNSLNASNLAMGTGHPQGGNAISGTESKGVVDPSFKVYGLENLYVCDASVFPSSIGVNPQITVMALARYATNLIK